MNSDNIILRGTENAPLVNKDDVLTIEEIDSNFISIYNDFIALSNAEDTTLTFDFDRTYLVGEYSTYDGRMWVATEISTGVTPIEGSADWNDIFPTILAHKKNKDTILDEGGANETTVAEIRAFIDAGLTSTTNLTLSTKTATSFKIESSTGADVTIPQANNEEAGLLNATDKVKLNNLTGVNTGDQTLVSLNAEDVDNKVTDFTTINDTLYPTTQAVDTYLTAQVPPLVETFIGGIVAQDLQDVTTVGNTTTDNIEFTGGVGVLFDNTSTLRKGTIDAGYGGAKGIAQICSVGYELKWEAGRLYVMGDGGTTIREVSHNFTTTPGATDDNTKGFIVGSRWILDNGDLYICTDTTTATAVWVLQTIDASPTDGSTKAVSSNGVFDALADKVDKVVGSRLITSAEGTILGNTSGINSGDETVTTIKTKLGITTLSGSNTGDQDLSGLVVKANNLSDLTNTTTARTNLGLGSLATQSGTFSGTSSGTNTGDETVSTIKTKLGITTLSGSNTGDQDLTPYATKSTPTFTGLTTLDTLKVTTGNYITPVDVVGIDVLGNVNRISASNGRTALGLGTLATQSGTFSGTSSGTNTGDQTFLNARVQTVTSSATVTPTNLNDLVIITAQAVGLTLANPTGTFTEGQALMIRIKDNGTARSIAFDTNYRAIGVTLPTTTVISKTMYLGIIYNATDSKWDIVGYNIQA